jgi:hypothetical protein
MSLFTFDELGLTEPINVGIYKPNLFLNKTILIHDEAKLGKFTICENIINNISHIDKLFVVSDAGSYTNISDIVYHSTQFKAIMSYCTDHLNISYKKVIVLDDLSYLIKNICNTDFAKLNITFIVYESNILDMQMSFDFNFISYSQKNKLYIFKKLCGWCPEFETYETINNILANKNGFLLINNVDTKRIRSLSDIISFVRPIQLEYINKINSILA